MKLEDIPFEDQSFRACVLESKCTDSSELTELNARKRKIKHLGGIEHLTELTFIDLTKNMIEHADFSANTKLEELMIGNNRLETLVLTNCKELCHLEIFMNDLEALDLSQNKLLENLYANQNDLEQLDLSNNTALEDLRLDSNNLYELDLNRNIALSRLDIGNNPLTQTPSLPKSTTVEVNLG